MKQLITTADHLKAYSRGEVSSSHAIAGIGASGFAELLQLMSECELPLPRGQGIEDIIEKEVQEGIPILRAIMEVEEDSA